MMCEIFAAPEPKAEPVIRVCSKCGTTTKNPRSLCWDLENICPLCYHKQEEKPKEKTGNPLYTKMKLADPSPITIFLNKFTQQEILNLESGF